MPNIKTFCRIKPTEETYEEFEATQDSLTLRVPELLKDFTNVYKGSRSYISHEFNFDHIFPQSASQADIFDVAAMDIIKGFLEGYNGTIFAYGQTGTGKTYTMEGNAKTYNSRGIGPRSLSMIYKALEKREDEDLSIHLSYIEIYQDIGYDLLNPGLRLQSYVTPFPKVSVLEGHDGMCVVKNLSNHLAASEDVAQSLLLQGQANRKVAATAIHERSSRSHAVFTIQLTSKKLNSDTIVRSKLHLVDLAGSERVAKTGVHGQQLTEAKSINLSLHHLETVIVALQQESLARDKSNRVKTSSGARKYTPLPRPSSAEGLRGPRHVPYRNSLLTMLLRDSLGGNCMTSMIATISLEISNLGESISTCRFAGRVACIANTVARNEQLDDKSLIKKLRKRIAELEAELACLRLSKEGGGDPGSMRLTEEDKVICSQVVKQYLSGTITDPVTAGITNPYKFRECLKILKRVISKNGYEEPGRRSSLSVVVPRHSPVPGDEGDKIGDLVNANDRFERRNYQKLRLDGQPDKRVSTADTNGHRDSRSSRPTTTSTLAWSDSTPSRMSRASTNLTDSRQVSASTRVTMNSMNTSQTMSTLTPEKIWFSPTRKEPDTLSELLENDSIVKTPFEQKRISEIKKLNNKVEKMSAEKLEKEQQAFGIKMQVAEKELDLMERHMQTKVAVTKAQVEDQHAYVKQLTSTEADPALLEQEKLVEKQLRKRKDKYERQLKYIEYRREQLKKHSEESGDTTNDKKASIQEKFGQFRKRDGSLNTRQVFQMLQQEEKKQIKVQNHLEREKMQAAADLMEIKELATRQKLRDLKEAMKLAPGAVPNGAQNGTDSGANGEADDQRNKLGKGPENVVRFSKGENLNQSANRTGFNNSLYRDGTFTKDKSDDRPVTSDSQPGNDFPKKKDLDPKARWESNYSRPTTPSNLKIPETDISKTDSADKDLKQSKDAKNHEKSKENEQGDRPDDHRAGKLVNGMDKPSQQLHNGLSDDLIESQSKKIEEELYKSKNNRFRERNRNLYDREGGHQGPTQTPSEYVHGMANSEQFDARRMGLSAKNFDSALHSMLGGQENSSVIPKNEDYEQFARTSKYRPNPYLEAATQKISQTRLKSRQSSRPPTREPTSKPKAKDSDRKARDSLTQDSGSPVKVNQSLQRTPSKERSNKGSQRQRPVSEGTDSGYNMDEFLRNNSFTTLNTSGGGGGTSFEIEEEHHGQVKAMQEQEREQNFMSRAQLERSRINRIRQARQSAEIIQRAWRRYIARKKNLRR